MNTTGSKVSISNIVINLFFSIFSLVFIMPFLMVLAVSLSNEEDILKDGYKLIPMRFDLTGYRWVFSNPQQIIDSYKFTALQSILGTILAVLLMALCAYSLSRRNFKFRGPITYMILFTMVFSGGLMPTYMLIKQYLHLEDTLWVYILPILASPFQIIVFRTFFQELPDSLIEAAKIDGAGEGRIFFQIVMPLSKPVIATISLICLLDRWNNWNTSLLYVQDQKLYTLQYLLQRILREADYIRSIAKEDPLGALTGQALQIPMETMMFAMCVIAAGPMLLVFPFFQKYFARGLTVGGVKG